MTKHYRGLDPGAKGQFSVSDVIMSKIGIEVEHAIHYIRSNIELNRSEAVRVGLVLLAKDIQERLGDVGPMEGGRERRELFNPKGGERQK